jgi:acyl-[acyl-carrier-protein]-phospholipid O-acyltransferase/long-chain-fatty-acid--[acyl-carrier-protein] ligase
MAACPANVSAAIVETARRCPSAVALQDVTRKELSYRRCWPRRGPGGAMGSLLPAGGGRRVGVLLPNANAVPVTLLSLWAVDKVPAIFNFSTGVPTMLACAQLAEVKHVITSRLFLERAKLNVQPMKDAGLEFIYLEDVRAGISRGRQWSALGQIILHPRSIVGPQQRAVRP